MTVQYAEDSPEDTDGNGQEGENSTSLLIHLYLEVNLVDQLNPILERDSVVATMMLRSMLSESIVMSSYVNLMVVMLVVSDPRYSLRQ
jgi:hypothetical protein